MFKAEKIFKILQTFIIGFNGLIIFCGWINIFSKRLLSVPVLINLLKNESTWKEEEKECPGINKGNKVSFEEILKAKELYENNFPIRKTDL